MEVASARKTDRQAAKGPWASFCPPSPISKVPLAIPGRASQCVFLLHLETARMGRDGTASGAAKCVGVCSGSSDCLGLIILHVGNDANATGSHANITICILSPPPAPSAHTRHRNGAVSALGAFFGRRRRLRPPSSCFSDFSFAPFLSDLALGDCVSKVEEEERSGTRRRRNTVRETFVTSAVKRKIS